MQFVADDGDIGGFAQGYVGECQAIEAGGHRNQIELKAPTFFS